MSTLSPQSPCISICTLDEQDVCMGCARTLDEIIDWAMMDDPAKQAVLDRLAIRLEAHEKSA
ncbi:MAG: DUF1289 domain-containing protein [Woeseiaceae bacterium]